MHVYAYVVCSHLHSIPWMKETKKCGIYLSFLACLGFADDHENSWHSWGWLVSLDFLVCLALPLLQPCAVGSVVKA